MSYVEQDVRSRRADAAIQGERDAGFIQREWHDRHDGINVGEGERLVSVAAGVILGIAGLSRRSLPGLLVAGIGGGLLNRGMTGHCPAYAQLGVDTAEPDWSDTGRAERETAHHGIHVEQSFLINRPPQDLYTFWRNFENLPGIMTHLKSVRTDENGRSHWIADAPGIAGGQVEWDAEVTSDEPDRAIAWRSLPGSEIDCTGSIRFTPAMGDRGTEVHVLMEYVPPGGRVGHWVATLFGKAPRRQMRDDLRRFKQLMETGEIPTIEGQPRGKCLSGGGKRVGQ